jgi:hypothetical protein
MTKIVAKLSVEKREAKIAKSKVSTARWNVEKDASVNYVAKILKANGIQNLDTRAAPKTWDSATKQHRGIDLIWSGTDRDKISILLTLHNDVDATAVMSALTGNGIAAKLSEHACKNIRPGYAANGRIEFVC